VEEYRHGHRAARRPTDPRSATWPRWWNTVEENAPSPWSTASPHSQSTSRSRPRPTPCRWSNAVRQAVADLGGSCGGTEIQIVRDSSVFIRERRGRRADDAGAGRPSHDPHRVCSSNSWRSTVITGLTLPISVISRSSSCTPEHDAHMLTRMALSLASGSLRRRDRGAGEHRAPPGAREDHFTAAREAPRDRPRRSFDLDVDHGGVLPVAS